MKNILNIGKLLNKDEQQKLMGGGNPKGCIGCTTMYFCHGASNACAFPGANGETCYGTHDGTECCVGF